MRTPRALLLVPLVALALVAPAAGGGSGSGTIDTVAAVPHPRSIALLPGGGFLVVDAFVDVVQRVDSDGTVVTVAGSIGEAGYSGDGGPATAAHLKLPHSVARLADGSFLIADTQNDRIRRVGPDGTITTVAGSFVHGFAGDGGPATQAGLNSPRGVAALPGGGFLIADSDDYRVRLVTATGEIRTVAGNGTPGFAGDGGPATQARIGRPFGVAALPGGGFLIVDPDGQRIRRVSPGGTITTVAGNGTAGLAGDGGPATSAELNGPSNVAPLPDEGFLIADTGNHRIRRVWPNGRITTVAGTGSPGFTGDGGPATAAMLNSPKALAVRADRLGYLIADSENDRVRSVAVDLRLLAVRTTARSFTGRHGAPIRVGYTLSIPASVRVEVRRRGTLVLTRRLRGQAGRNTAVLRLPAGSYVLRLVAGTPDGRSAAVSASVVVSR